MSQGRKFSRADLVVFFLSGAVLLGTAVLLVLEMRQSYGDGVGRPVGELSYRNRVVQRRSAAQVVWERLNPKDTVFNGDSVRTDETAEAIIDLEDGSKIELDPESLIVLHLRDKISVSLVKGSAIVKAGSNGLIVERDGRSYTAKGGAVRFFVDPSDPKNGNAETDATSSLFLDDGTMVLRPGESLRTEGGKDQRIPRNIHPTLPEDNARLFFTGEEMEVEFRWQGGGTVVELYTGYPVEKNLKTYDAPNGAQLILTLPAGNYFWRVRRDNQVGPLRRLRLRRKGSPQLLLPRPDAKIHLSDASQFVAFRWQEDEFASSYYIELSHDRGFTDRAAYQAVQRAGISLPLGPGRYFWRVLSRSSVSGAESESGVFSFEVIVDSIGAKPQAGQVQAGDEEKAKLDSAADTTNVPQPNSPTAAPIASPVASKEPLALLYPVGVVDMTGKTFLLFRWKGLPSEERTLILRDATGTVVFQTKVKGNSFTLADLTVLDTGVFRWSLESSKETAQARFTIVLREKLTTPELEIR